MTAGLTIDCWEDRCDECPESMWDYCTCACHCPEDDDDGPL